MLEGTAKKLSNGISTVLPFVKFADFFMGSQSTGNNDYLPILKKVLPPNYTYDENGQIRSPSGTLIATREEAFEAYEAGVK